MGRAEAEVDELADLILLLMGRHVEGTSVDNVVVHAADFKHIEPFRSVRTPKGVAPGDYRRALAGALSNWLPLWYEELAADSATEQPLSDVEKRFIRVALTSSDTFPRQCADHLFNKQTGLSFLRLMAPRLAEFMLRQATSAYATNAAIHTPPVSGRRSGPAGVREFHDAAPLDIPRDERLRLLPEAVALGQRAGDNEFGPRDASAGSTELPSSEVDEPKLLRGLPAGPATEFLRTARAAELAGRYGDALMAARSALATAEELPNTDAGSEILIAVAKSQVSHCLLHVEGDPEEAWVLADAAADPGVLAAHRPQLFLALQAKAEAALVTGRITIAKGASAAAEGLAENAGDSRMVLQTRAQVALAEHDLPSAIRLYSEAADSFLAAQQTESDPAYRTRYKAGFAACLLNKGIAQQRAGDIGAATESFQRSALWYHESNSQFDESVARRFLAHALFDQQFWSSGHVELDTAIEVARIAQFWAGEADGLELRARALATQDENPSAHEALVEALAVVETNDGDPRQVRRLLQMLATLEGYLGQQDSAEERLSRARDLAEADGDTLAVADVDVQRSVASGVRRSTLPASDEVVATLAEQVRTEERPGRAAYKSHQLAGAYRSRGELDQAAAWFQRACEKAKAIGDRGLAASSLIGLGELALHRRDVAAANSTFDEAAAMASGLSDPEILASLQYFKSKIMRADGALREARAMLSEALDLAGRAHLDDLVQGIHEDLDELDNEASLFTPAMSLGQLAAELADLEAWYPEQRQAIRRLWYYWRDTEVLANLRGQASSKSLYVSDNMVFVEHAIEGLGTLFDLNAYVTESAFARDEPVLELTPFPGDRPLPFCVNVVSSEALRQDIERLSGGRNADPAG